jgi:hypothetical protein
MVKTLFAAHAAENFHGTELLFSIVDMVNCKGPHGA